MPVQHPISPPPELVGQWLCSEDYLWGPLEQASITITTNRLQNVATLAARWGADQELEAVEEEIIAQGWFANSTHRRAQLRAARRPKPPSLKEQALEQLGCIQTDLNKFGMGISTDTIRRALEALDD
jgi:hypothetical protein